jgi:hypothetical protein
VLVGEPGQLDRGVGHRAARLGVRVDGVTSIRDEDELARTGGLPPWRGKASVHESHRSALVRKDPGHYRRFFPDVPR